VCYIFPVFGLGMGEIVVILVVALLVLGPTQLPDAAKQVGKAIRALRKHTRDLQETIDKDEAIGGTVRELRSALRGDDLFREPLLPNPPPTIASNAPSPPSPIAPSPPPAAEPTVAQGDGAAPSTPPPPSAPGATRDG
jgi:sec-independent protein translocase protein TatB